MEIHSGKCSTENGGATAEVDVVADDRVEIEDVSKLASNFGCLGRRRLGCFRLATFFAAFSLAFFFCFFDWTRDLDLECLLSRIYSCIRRLSNAEYNTV